MSSGGPALGDLLSAWASPWPSAWSSASVWAGSPTCPFDTFPAFALAGLALGVVAACVYFYKTFKRYS